MSLLKKLFGRKERMTKENLPEEPWFNDTNDLYGKKSSTRVDPLTGKKKKPLMDPIFNHIPGNAQDSNSIHKSGV